MGTWIWLKFYGPIYGPVNLWRIFPWGESSYGDFSQAPWERSVRSLQAFPPRCLARVEFGGLDRRWLILGMGKKTWNRVHKHL